MGKMDTAPTINQGPITEYRYGWFSFTPNSLQGVNKAVWFLVFMCFSNVFQSMTINGLIGVVLSSLETRFGLTSGQSSWIVSSYDVSTVPVLAIVSYFGSRSHRPRWTSAGLFVLILGTAIFVLPHFTTPAYNPGASTDDNDQGLCMTRNDTDGGDSGRTENFSGYLAVFILGRILHGIGAVPLYTIAVTFMDDTVTKEGFSLYIAFFYAAGVLGPALGYIVGGSMLTIFTDFSTVDTDAIGLDSSSRNWVGAWWIGFLVGAVALAIVCIPMSGYPRDLPGAAEIRATKESEAYNSGKDNEDDFGAGEVNVSAKDLPRYFKDLLFNPTYVFLTLMVCCDSLLMGGFTAFGPKYVEEQFSISAALSGMMFGIVVIPGGAGGTVAGGVIVKKMGLKCAGIMKGELMFTIAIMLTALMFVITCDPLDFVGVTVGYGDSPVPETAAFNASCNMDCTCDTVDFQPICSVNNYQYFSPCHAGCESMEKDGSINNFFNCSCITATENVTDLFKPAASNEQCSVKGCNYAPLFMVIFFAAMFCLFSCSSMNITATVRCLPASHRSLGIGVQWIFLRLLGTVPGPLTFGAAFDGACQLFSLDEKGERQQCLFYDKQKMAMYLLLICVVVKLASLVFIILAWKLYKPPQNNEDESELNVDGEEGEKGRDEGKGVANTGFQPEMKTVTNGGLYPTINGDITHDSYLDDLQSTTL